MDLPMMVFTAFHPLFPVLRYTRYPAAPFTCFQLKMILFLPEILIEDMAGAATVTAACTSATLISSGTVAGAAVASIKPVKMPHKAFFQFLFIRFFPFCFVVYLDFSTNIVYIIKNIPAMIFFAESGLSVKFGSFYNGIKRGCKKT